MNKLCIRPPRYPAASTPRQCCNVLPHISHIVTYNLALTGIRSGNHPAPMTQQNEAQPPPGRIVRKLADIELYHTATHLLNQYIGTVVHAKYTIPQNAVSPHAIFETAIAQTILQHPVLQVGIIGEDSPTPSFVELSRINLRNHITWLSLKDTSKEAVLQEQLDAKFTNLKTTPGWKIVILTLEKERCLDVLFVWNHAICDGMSGKIFHESLLHNLNSTNSHDAKNIQDGFLHLPKITHFPPAATSTKYPISLAYLATSLWDEYKPSVFTCPTHWAPIRLSPYKTTFQSLMFTHTVLQNTLAACRQHKTTLTALLHAITLVSLASTIPSEKGAGFRAETPLDMRRFTPPNEGDITGVMANICSYTHHNFDKNMMQGLRQRINRSLTDTGANQKANLVDIVWSIAEQVRQEIRTALGKGTRDNILGLMTFVADWKKQMVEYAGKPRLVGWVVTNIGVLDGNFGREEGDWKEWKLDEARFTLSAQASGAAISISVVSVAGGLLCVDVSWQDGVIDEMVMEKLVTDLREWVGYLGMT